MLVIITVSCATVPGVSTTATAPHFQVGRVIPDNAVTETGS
ncbi:MAG TPA: hypothetical protein VGO68_06550 [Pyrinomonadaceae bacterium]|nr:hypothetical protein [Pyrinomonadaceae bacterium]